MMPQISRILRTVDLNFFFGGKKKIKTAYSDKKNKKKTLKSDVMFTCPDIS